MQEDSPTHYMFAEPEKFNLTELLRAVKEHEEWEEPDFNPERSWVVVQHKSGKVINNVAKANGFHIPLIPYLYQSTSNTELVVLGWMKATSQPPCHPWSRPSPVTATGKKNIRPTHMPFTRKKQWKEIKHSCPRSCPYPNGSSGQLSPPFVVPPVPLNKRTRPPSRRVTCSNAKGVPLQCCTHTPMSYIHHRIR